MPKKGQKIKQTKLISKAGHTLFGFGNLVIPTYAVRVVYFFFLYKIPIIPCCLAVGPIKLSIKIHSKALRRVCLIFASNSKNVSFATMLTRQHFGPRCLLKRRGGDAQKWAKVLEEMQLVH